MPIPFPPWWLQEWLNWLHRSGEPWDQFAIFFCVTETVLLFGPLLAVLGAVLVTRLTDRNQRRVLGACVIACALVVLGWLSGWSVVGIAADWWLVACAFVAYCVLAFTVVRVRRRWLARAGFAVMILPILCGYLLGTVGILAVAFAVGQAVPVYQQTDRFPFSCRARRSGGATTSVNGDDVTILWRPRWFPVVEHVTLQRGFTDDGRSPSTLCEIVAAPFVPEMGGKQ